MRGKECPLGDPEYELRKEGSWRAKMIEEMGKKKDKEKTCCIALPTTTTNNIANNNDTTTSTPITSTPSCYSYPTLVSLRFCASVLRSIN